MIIFFIINISFNEFQDNAIIEINYNIFLRFNFVNSIKIYNNEAIIGVRFVIKIDIRIDLVIKTLSGKNKIRLLLFQKRIDNDLNKTRNNIF